MIRLWTTFLFCTLLLGQSIAQESCDSVYVVVDEMPVYKNGLHDFVRDLTKNLIFKKACPPSEVRQFNWTINKQGKMVDIDIPNIDQECEDQLIAQFKKMQPWTPGRLRGRVVCVTMRVPICIKTD